MGTHEKGKGEIEKDKDDAGEKDNLFEKDRQRRMEQMRNRTLSSVADPSETLTTF